MITDKPVNEIIRIAEVTQNLPSTGKANKQEPSFSLRNIGYDDDQFASAEELNYTFDNIGQWLQYFEDRVDELQSQIEKERISVGEIIEITGDNTNPSILKGYGTWESFGEGLVTVGVGEYTSKIWTDGQTEGSYTHTLTESEIPIHDHGVSGTTESDSHNHTFSGTTASDTHNHKVRELPSGAPQNINADGWIDDSTQSTTGSSEYTVPTDEDTHSHSYSGTTANDSHSHEFSTTSDVTGGDGEHNNTQPTIAVYRWKRTA